MATIKLLTKSGEVRYRVSFWLNNQVIETKTFKRKIDADTWHRNQLNAATDGKIGRRAGERVTLAEFYQNVYLVKHRVSEGTLTDYRRIFDKLVLPQFGSRKLSDIKKAEWSDFLTALRGDYSPARVNRIHSAVSAVYALAVEEDYLVVNPLRSLRRYKESLSKLDFWTEAEVQDFLTKMYGTKNPRFALYQTAYETGMRFSELAGLRWDCVNLEEGYIEVRRNVCKITGKLLETTKSGHRRVIPISEGLRQTLETILKDDFVFTQSNGNPITYTYIRRQFKNDQTRAGVRLISFHTLRHTFASHFVMKGESIYDLQALLGHSDTETTKRYAHLSRAHLKSKAGIVKFLLTGPNTFPILETATPRKTGQMVGAAGFELATPSSQM